MIKALGFWVFVRAENPIKDNLVQFRETITDEPTFFFLVVEILSKLSAATEVYITLHLVAVPDWDSRYQNSSQD